MTYTQTELCDCHSEIKSDNKFNSDDVNLFGALVSYHLDSSTTLSFSDFYTQRVNTGNSVSLVGSIPTNLTKEYVNYRLRCFDFDQSETLDQIDIEIYQAFQAWNDSRGTHELLGEQSEHQSFVDYCESLITQGLLNLSVNFANVILPSLQSVHHSTKC